MSNTLGNSTTPAQGYSWDDFGNTQFWTGFTMPAGGGVVTDIYAYFGGDGSTPSSKLCIWDSTNLLWSSPSFTPPSYGRSVGGQGWQHQSVPNFFVPAGTVNLGWWTSGNVVWTWESSGSATNKHSMASPGSLSSPSGATGGGGLGVYIVYSPGGGRVRRAGSWNYQAAQARRTSAWSTSPGLDVRRSTSWNPGT